MSQHNRKGIFGGRWGLLGAALLFSITACSSESPTAPTPGGGNGGGGGTPPTGANVVVTASNPNPVVSSTSTITATVTQNGQPVPNGTAVEFSTTLGTFTDTASATSIRTTTNGVATVVLTSSVAGPAKVTARVNNVSQNVDLQFRVSDPGTGGGGATITSVDPAMSGPGGGQIVTIRGTGFDDPVRVMFGNREANVISVSPTEIRVVVPSITLGATEQAREVNIVVINNAGSEGEVSITAPSPFRYQIEVLTPVVYGVSPASGPREGETRITIFGEGFQSPVKVYFGTGGAAGAPLTDQVELEVIRVSYGQIEALTPPIWDLYSQPGSVVPNTLQVVVRVQNLGSNTDAIQQDAFRYGPLMHITAVGPTQGAYTGGTDVTIHGWGFDDPVAVSIGGFAAQPIRVSGTEIVVRTLPIALEDCEDVTGPITVTNIEDGVTVEASGLAFTYRVPTANIIGVSPSSPTLGSSVAVTVFGAGNPAFGRFRVGEASVFPSGVTVNGDGTTTFTVVIPDTVELDTQECEAGGEREVATSIDLTYTNTATSCEDTLEGALTVLPTPGPELFVTSPPPAGNTTVGTSSTTQFSIVNTGNGTLTVNSVASSSPQFTATPAQAPPVALGPCESLDVTVTFTPIAPGAQSATITVNTDDGSRSVQASGTGQVPAP